jgi:hypothetical protein
MHPQSGESKIEESGEPDNRRTETLTLERATGKNMSGMRSIWNRVSEAKMTAGSRVWPESEYETNEMTEASTGSENATALFAERTSSRDRIYLSSLLRKFETLSRYGFSLRIVRTMHECQL